MDGRWDPAHPQGTRGDDGPAGLLHLLGPPHRERPPLCEPDIRQQPARAPRAAADLPLAGRLDEPGRGHGHLLRDLAPAAQEPVPDDGSQGGEANGAAAAAGVEAGRAGEERGLQDAQPGGEGPMGVEHRVGD